MDNKAKVWLSCRGAQYCLWPLEENRSRDCQLNAEPPNYPLRVRKAEQVGVIQLWEMLQITVSLFFMSFCLGLESFHPLKQTDAIDRFMKLHWRSHSSDHQGATLGLFLPFADAETSNERNIELKPTGSKLHLICKEERDRNKARKKE